MDLNSITAYHYINAGLAGLVHFNLILNAFIVKVTNTTIVELNKVLALLLYKGHKKDRTLDSSYRTISTCPLIAKGLDVYVRELAIDKWNRMQAPTQYQGEGSNHELAALLVTEAIQHSKYVTKDPIYLLFLDARSAFDRVHIPYLIRCLYRSGMEAQAVSYIENRLSNRVTFCEFDKAVVGPIHDELGLEQGGVSSSDLYKLYNNELLDLAQKSKLGVKLGSSLVISAVGQADDTVIVSDNLERLQLLCHLVKEYCKKYNVHLSPSKTKLLMMTPPHSKTRPFYSPITIENTEVSFSSEAEHVGILRAVSGNTPAILNKIASFKKALGAVISCGLARGQRSNPAVSIQILKIYGTPVLLSGMASLVLLGKEIATIETQYKRSLQNILKLPASSPSSLVHFVAGTLPVTALLHLRILTLFGMICRLPGDPLNLHAQQVFLTRSLAPKSWFSQVWRILLQYHLPNPLLLLNSPLSKEAFKKQVKTKVIDYWEKKLRDEAYLLPSLRYFHPQYMSLSKTHRLWTTSRQKPYEVSKARIQLLFLGSLYRCGQLTRHWSASNPLGFCSFTPCSKYNIVESPEHVLL